MAALNSARAPPPEASPPPKPPPAPIISSTPAKPASTAAQRWRPTRSPRSGIDSTVRKSGEEKPIATASASGMIEKAVKMLIIETNCSAPRARCSLSRCVRSRRSPPCASTITATGASENRQRKNTTSPTG